MEITFQEKKLRPLAEVEQSEQMIVFRMGTRAFELVGRNKKRTLFGKGGGFDFNQPITAVGLKQRLIIGISGYQYQYWVKIAIPTTAAMRL